MKKIFSIILASSLIAGTITHAQPQGGKTTDQKLVEKIQALKDRRDHNVLASVRDFCWLALDAMGLYALGHVVSSTPPAPKAAQAGMLQFANLQNTNEYIHELAKFQHRTLGIASIAGTVYLGKEALQNLGSLIENVNRVYALRMEINQLEKARKNKLVQE